MDELTGDLEGQHRLAQKIKEMQLNLIRERRGGYDCDIDFVKHNIDETDYFETHKHMQEITKQIFD